MTEQLENRTLLTVVFPLLQYGNETPVYMNSDGLKDPTVNIVFAGNWSNYESDKATLLTRLESIVTGPFLSGLAQYSASGTASMGAVWNDPNNSPGATLSNAPTTNDLQSFLQHSISTYGSDPGLHGLDHSPMYIVVEDPTTSAGDNGGFNLPGLYVNPSDPLEVETIQMEWVGTGLLSNGHVDLDHTTATFGHELAERCVNNATMFYLPSAYDVSPGVPKLVQVSDGEEENNYYYRLNGALVQAYYSALDNAAIVPDVNYADSSERFILDPLPWVNGRSTGHYNVVVDGDQLADHNDLITVGQTSAGGVSITLNTETIGLEPGETHSLTISSGTGQDSIFINALLAPTTILSASPANGPDDNILIGNGNTQYLNAPLTIINTLGYDAIDVSDEENPYSDGSVDVLNKGGSPGVGEVAGLAPEDIYFTYSQTRSLYIDDGSGGANFVSVVNAGVPIYVDGHNEVNGAPDVFETVNPSGLAEPVTFHDTGPYTMEVYDAGDNTARSIGLSSGASGYGEITGFGGAAINYAYANANVMIYADSSANTGTLLATGAPTTFYSGLFRELQTAAGTTATLSGVTITGGFNGGILNLGNLIVANSVVSGNSNPMAFGGGISNLGNLTITHSSVQGNSTPGDGGGIDNDQNATLVIDNSLITGNSAGDEGGGVYNLGTVTLLNATFSANNAASGGGEYNDGSSILNVTNSILYGDEGVEIVNNAFGGAVVYAAYNDIEGSTPGGHDTSANPGLTSSFRLSNQSSPAVDAGLNSAVPAYDTKDLAGNTRIVHGTVDMGAFEFQGPFVTATPTLGFIQQPTNVTVNQAMSPPVIVGVTGSIATDNSFVSLYEGSTLVGKAQLSGGEATFDNSNSLVFTSTGTSFTLLATDGSYGTATSNPFQVSAVVPPPALGMGALPVNPTAGVAFSPSITVTGAANGTTMYLSVAINGVAGSTLQAQVVSGVATFPYTPTVSGSYSFTATDTGDVQAYTAFSVAPPASAPPTILHLVFANQPGSIMAGNAVASPATPIIVYVENQNGTLMTDDMVTISVPSPFDVAGQYSVAAVNGVATFGTSYNDSIYVGLNFNDAAPNSCYLVASDTTPADTSAIPATSSLFLVTPNVTHALAVSDATAVAGTTFDLTVQANDIYDDLSTDLSGDSVTLSVQAGPAGGTLLGNLTATLQGSAAIFTGLSVNVAGGYTIIATDSNSPNLQHSGGGVNITAAQPTQLEFLVQPGTVAAGAIIEPNVVVGIEDSFGNVVSTDNSDQVALSIASGPTSTLSGSTTVTVQNGLATFGDISIGQTGTYTLNASSGAYAAVNSNSFSIVPAALIRVDQNATGVVHDGTSWANAYTTLQAALAVAVPGDAIEIAQGDYSPSTNLSNPAATFQLIDGVIIQGGYETGGLSGPNPTAYPTILDGMHSFYHVITGTGTDPSAVLQGFTITGGDASGAGDSNSGLGGGLFIDGGSPTISNCLFTNNTAGSGGAVYMSDGSTSASLVDCSFTDNTATTAGGAVYLSDSSPLLVNDLFAGNLAPSAGAIFNYDSSPTITNSTFTANTGYNDGAIVDEGIAGSNPTLVNSILWNDSPAEIVNDVGTAIVNYSDISSGYSGTSNINNDPALAIDFHLLTGSAAVGAGEINAPGLANVETDLAGQPRTDNGTVDLGAYEGAVAPIIFVDASATGSNNGTSWSNAFTSLQSALSVAVSGYSIEIAQGSYSPGSNPTDTFQLINGVTLQGGYPSGGSTSPNPAVSQAVLNGGYSGGNNYNVVTAVYNNATAILEGVSIENGGGGGEGGGLLINDCTPTITDCAFINNSASAGGALYCFGGGPTLTLTDCIFENNSAINQGGAIFDYNSTPNLVNCLFVGNSANRGGAIENYLGSFPTFTNCTFTGNTAFIGGAFDNEDSSAPTLTNCILWNDVGGEEISSDNTSEDYVSYSDIDGGYFGAHNINTDPLFVDPADGNYLLEPGSPAFAAGNASATGLQGITTDLAGNPRFVNGAVDMGAYEVQQPGIYWTGDGDGLNWNVAGNWSDDMVPTQQDNVTIGAGFTNVQVSLGSFAVNTLTASSPVELAAGGTLTLDGFSTISDGLTIDNGGMLELGTSGLASNPGPLVVDGLNILPGGILNVGSSAMVVQGGSLFAITNEIATGFHDGTWTGEGITSSAAQHDPTHLTELGVILNNDGAGNPLYGTGGMLGSFDGYSPELTDILVKPTIVGDTDLAGGVDAADYLQIDNAYNVDNAYYAANPGGTSPPLTGWFNGDFNYDGVINGDDYTLIDNAYNSPGPQGTKPEAQIASPFKASTGATAAAEKRQVAAVVANPIPGNDTDSQELKKRRPGIWEMLES